ncbi:hypothetical protein EB74_11635 [Mycobacterium sp. SWH-M5]|uniref:ATP-binding protein n=1 Tax=Mycolicibacterium goodii TaxID=134601 RepID=UPI000939300B|nr:ATP-binding protein [Mycolicibacterium goodii]MBU8817558.1 ATP-binding protein [Mycolicibacterium goodii]OKH63964.1 hypothetical protein EB74_11635 [Mycobacterium sp. SWH-M5]
MGWSDGKVAPLQDLYGNVHFSPFGVFAYWIVTPPDKPLANESRAAASAAAHRELTEILPAKPAFACTSTLKDPRFIYDQQVKGVDLQRYPLFAHVAEGRRIQAEVTQPRFPVYWMWVRLEPHGNPLNPFSWAHRRLVRAGFLAPKADAATLDEYMRLMWEVEQKIPPQFSPIRPTAPQIRWLHRRQHTLGVVDEPLPLPEYSDGAMLGHRWQAQIDLDEHELQPMLKVTAFDDGRTESFQIHAAVTTFPAGGIYFPGSNFTAMISALQDRNNNRVHVDWAQRAHSLPLRKANRRQEKSLRKINEQYDQQTGRRITTELAQSEEALEGFEEDLMSHPREAEVVYTTYFTVGAASAREAREGFESLREVLEEVRVEIAAPVGQQKRMFRAIRPGVEDLSIQDPFAQYTSRTGWARHIPLTTTRFGDTGGRAIGLNKMSGDLDFVFLDTRGEVRRYQSGGMIIGGDPRKGKTHFAMLNAGEEAISGACVVMFDATRQRQWRKFAKVVPGSGAIDLANGDFTADPLVTIGGQQGAALIVNELVRIAGEPANSDAATELRLLVASRPWPSTAALLEFMTTDPSCPPPLQPLGRRLLGWATSRTAEALFGRVNERTGRREPLPMLSLDEVTLLVCETQDLGLPTEEEVAAANSGGDPLSEEQMIAQSVMALFAAYLRKVFYGRQTRDILGFDEGWRTVSMKVLHDLVFEIFRTGPAANVDVWLISQKPWHDFAGLDDDLARVRVLFAVEDGLQARAAVRWMGIDPDRYPDIAKTLSTELSPRTTVRDAFHRSSGVDVVDRDRLGECLIRMGDGEHGWIKAFENVFPEWEEAADTRPELT